MMSGSLARRYRMYRRFLVVVACAEFVSAAGAQTQQHRATLTPSGNSSLGKCTIEVVVDGSADIEVSGDSALVRNHSGQQPQWRRFECTARLPSNPASFRFSGVDGRGKQELIRDPQNGGLAIVRIEDPKSGAEAYTFDLNWDAAASTNYPPYADDRSIGRQASNKGRGRNRRFATDDAVRACQDAVRSEATSQRFEVANLTFGTTTVDDKPGRREYVVGTFDVPGRRGVDTYQFSCSVNFDGRQIRSAKIERQPNRRDFRRNGDRATSSNQQVQTCERALSERFRLDGYTNVKVDSINVGAAQGRYDSIVGTARANRNNRPDSFNFSCSVDNLVVRSIDLQLR
jgi:hypothetical protein